MFCIFCLFPANIIFALALSFLFLAGCGADEEGAGGAAMPQNQQTMAQYSDDNLSFDIPESWQKNFKAVTRDVGSSGNTYPQTDFYYTEGERDIRLMSIGKFTKEQWDKMKSDGKVSDDAILGRNTDNTHVYSVFYEDHDYIEDGKLRDSLNKIRGEAEKLRDKMKIK